MILGKIFGKVTTNEFKFLVTSEVKKFEYIQIYHQVYDYVLAQVIEIEKREDTTTADCQIIGYFDKKTNTVKSLRIPLEPNTEVFLAEDEFIEKMIRLSNTEVGAYLGKLDGKDIKVHLNLKKLLTKHLAVLAKSGSGKSYTVGVLLEEIIDKKVPLLIIDPHGEYSTLKYPNTDEEEKARMPQFNIFPKKFPTQEYSDTKINLYTKPLKLPNDFTPQELVELLPQKLSNNQIGVLHNAIKTAESTDFSEIILALNQEESSIKYSLIGLIEQLRALDIFSQAPTPYHEIIKSGIASIINLRGIEPDIQDIIVYKLTKDLFELRKQNKIPPFFLVIEEAHNFCVTAETKISTLSGLKSINKLKHEKIITLNSKTNKKETNELIKIWPKRKAKVMQLISETGRKLICTPDHPIYYKGNYVAAEKTIQFSIPIESTYICSNERLIYARLLGAIFSDGWMSKNKQVGFSGKNEDMLLIKEDLSKLNLKSSNIVDFINKNPSIVTKNDGNKLTIFGSGSSIHCSTNAFNKFKHLGAHVGEKVIQNISVPSWILNGSKKIKAEFLAGLMGGDGDKPSISKLNCQAIRLYFSKINELDKEAKKYAADLMNLFNELNVKTSLIIRKGNIRKKDGKKTTKYIISIHNENDNLINFFEKINYRYNLKKEVLSKQILLYLKKKEYETKRREQLRQEALELKKKKLGKVKIARLLNTYSSLVAKWIYNSYNNKSASLTKNTFPTFENWKLKNCDNHFIYEKIINKKFIGERTVYNITTNNANYLANDILVHNCPERSFGEKKSSKILRTIASEGRKFGLGLCIISQRPARVDKSVISQCTTQIIMKLTNPNDLKAITSSVEGITSNTEKEIQNLSIGTALVTGITDVPLFINIRPRQSQHGGQTIDILNTSSIQDKEDDVDIFKELDTFKEKNILPIIQPTINKKDLILMSEKPIKKISQILIPGYIITCKEKDTQFKLIIETITGKIISDINEFKTKSLPDLDKLTKKELTILETAYKLKKFKTTDLIKKLGSNIDIQKDLNFLVTKNYLINHEDTYKLSEDFIFSSLTNFQTYKQIEFINIEYDLKQEHEISLDKIINKLQKFTTVIDNNEVYILKYELEYE
ncbi:MAG: DUF87 domain-containing protein [Candidatus Woesearchaeota archaeon]